MTKEPGLTLVVAPAPTPASFGCKFSSYCFYPALLCPSISLPLTISLAKTIIIILYLCSYIYYLNILVLIFDATDADAVYIRKE